MKEPAKDNKKGGGDDDNDYGIEDAKHWTS